MAIPDILEEINNNTKEFQQSFLLLPSQYSRPFRFKDLDDTITRDRIMWIQRRTGFSEDRIMCDLNFIILQPTIQTLVDVRSHWSHSYEPIDIATQVLYSWYKGIYEKEKKLKDLPTKFGYCKFKPLYAYITPENELEAILSFAWATGDNLAFIEEGLKYMGHQVHPRPNNNALISLNHVTKRCKVDILCFDKAENYVVIELKTQALGKNALEQIKRYITLLEQNWNTDKVRGILIGNGITEELQKHNIDSNYNIKLIDASPVILRMKIYRSYLKKVLYENQEHAKALNEAMTNLHESNTELIEKIDLCEEEIRLESNQGS